MPVKEIIPKAKRRRAGSHKPDRASLVTRLRNLHWTVWALLAVMLFFAIVRHRLRDVPLERDEGEYAYAGQLMLQGIPPYQLAYNMKLPGTYAAYAVIMGILGEDSAGIHLGLLLINAATTLLVYAIARKLFGSFTAAFAGMSYAALSANPALLGFSAHATHFVAFAACAGILLLLYAIESGRARTLLWSGSFLGLAFLMKQPGMVFFAFAVLYLIYVQLWPLNRRAALRRLGVLSLGFVWPFALTCALLAWVGVFHNFWFWCFSYARAYATEVPFFVGMQQLSWVLKQIVQFGTSIWALVPIGFVLLFLRPEMRRHGALIGGLLAFSAVGVSAGFYFRSHYFIVLLPVLAMLAGIAVGATREILQARLVKPALLWIPVALFATAFLASLWQERRFVFAPDANSFSATLYRDNPFIEARGIGQFLKENTNPDAKIVVFGSEPEIYFYSNRHSASGYIYTYGLMENQQFAKTMADQMITEVSQSKPEIVVFVDDGLSWLWDRGGAQEDFFRWIQMLVNTQYVKAAQVDIAGNAEHILPERPRIYVFQRKPQP